MDKDIHTSFIAYEENDSKINVDLQSPYTNHMDIIFVMKMNIIVLFKWSYRSSQLCWL